MEPVGALGGIFFGLAPRAGSILQQAASCRIGVPAVGLIAKLLEEIALKPPYVFFAEEGDGGVRMFSRAAYRGMATSCARWRRYDRCMRLQQTR